MSWLRCRRRSSTEKHQLCLCVYRTPLLLNTHKQTTYSVTAATRNLFRGGGCGSPVPSTSFLHILVPYFLPFPSLSSVSKWPLDPAKGFGGALLAPRPPAGTATFAATRHVPWALNTPDVDVDVDVESVLAQAERLFASFSNFYCKLQYQIRLHLLLKPHYDSQFREFALENRILFLDVANAYQVLF